MPTTPAIQGRGLNKSFRSGKTRVHPVRDVDISVARGESVCLTGHNGAGKTTLLKVFATLIKPDAGEGEILGHRLQSTRAIRPRIGLLTADERSFYWRLTGRQNLQFFGALQGLARRETSRLADHWAAQFGVDYLDRRLMTYSAGMKQRLGLIRCLLHDPDLLLLDEPTRSLDMEATEQFAVSMRRLVTEQKKTILLASHNPLLARKLCDRTLIMEEGCIVDAMQFEAAKQATTSGHRVVTPRLSAVELQAFQNMTGVESVAHDREQPRSTLTISGAPGGLDQVLRSLMLAGIGILDCQAREHPSTSSTMPEGST